MRKFQREYNSRHESYWKKETDDGSTRGDFISEKFQEFENLQQLNRYFGVLVVYGVFERFLYAIFREAKRLDLIRDKEIAKRPFLEFKRYLSFLERQLKIDLRKNQSRYAELRKLWALRNAIAHHAGWINSQNIRYLRQYGYCQHERIKLAETYFRERKKLVYQTCALIATQYDQHLNTQGVFKPAAKTAGAAVAN
ncbi:MAG: hypothetical protein ACRD4R_09970 [Candidatus Acidiferrales bacterium]